MQVLGDIKLQTLPALGDIIIQKNFPNELALLPHNLAQDSSDKEYQKENPMTDEESPFLSSNSNESEALIQGRASSQNDFYEHDQKTKSLWYMILLTVSIGGLQLAWSVELSNGTPYLISLGLSKSSMALVWIAGPLSGTLVQPYVGMLSDKCRSPWGKRTPFIILGSIATIISLLTLAWVREISTGFIGLFGIDSNSQKSKDCVILVAVLMVYVLDFSINTVQAGIRAFILDCAPSHQQESANAMASRALGVGNIIGYIAGYVNLKQYFWFFGDSQFKILCVIASLALASTVFLSLSTIRERDPSKEVRSVPDQAGIVSFFRTLFTSIKRLPPLTRKVCEIQFFAWIGMFPQLFYSSSYIGEIYVQPYLKSNPHMSQSELDQLYEKATRVGTFALLVYAITSLATNVILPFFIAPSYDTSTTRLFIPGFTLRRAWMLSQLIFAACMFSTTIVRSVSAATVLIGIIGICWALSLWAPFAIISAEVSKRDLLYRKSDINQCNTNNTTEKSQDRAGVILGIHNMSIAAPQIIATVCSSIIFKFLQKPRGTPGDISFSVVLTLGGFSTLVAAWLTSRMEDRTTLINEEYHS
ncbi:General alpha-glucoside permease [Erysiphe neolycopersici]|uniref:General alpha-glucoside permease n=1 Tax=Erysiphe neolycopersici TaxID=212602 RepID=A0A420HHP5_9PEZI|nr:General alpha-glucoside permease [Erysiphe neolycopersici]